MRSTGRLSRHLLESMLVAGVIAAGGCSGDSTGTSPQPSSIVFIGANTLTGTVGQALPQSLQVEVRDNRGQPLPNIAFTVTVSAGSITGAPAKTAVGTTSLGTWTLGTSAGAQTLTVTVAGLSPLVLQATALAGAASSITTGGVPTSANGTLGAVAPIQPRLKVTDAFNNPIVGVPVTVQVTGGGTVQFPSPVTDATGTASVGTWTLGPSAAAQTVSMTLGGSSPVVFTVTMAGQFHIELRFTGLVSPIVQSAAAEAVLRLRQIIVGDIPDQPINGNANGCVPGAGVLTETIDDLVIYVRQEALGTQSGTIAFAYFCSPVRLAPPYHPFLGGLVVNSDVINQITANSEFAVAVMTHELLHALGFGTLWQPFPGAPLSTLLQGVGTGAPNFMGQAGRAAYVAASGSASVGVPVEGQFGEGTANSHWRESSLRTELMTGFAEDPGVFMALSAITIGSLADIGYEVSGATAQPFIVPPGGGPPGSAMNGPVRLLNDTRPPQPILDHFGNPMLFAPPAVSRRR